MSDQIKKNVVFNTLTADVIQNEVAPIVKVKHKTTGVVLTLFKTEEDKKTNTLFHPLEVYEKYGFLEVEVQKTLTNEEIAKQELDEADKLIEGK